MFESWLLQFFDSIYSFCTTPDTDQGVTWAATSTPNSSWRRAIVSHDGESICGAPGNGNLYCSYDAGDTWVTRNWPPTGFFESIAGSYDLSIIVGCQSNSGGIWRSSDAGATFVLLPNAGTRNYFGIACDYHCQNIFAGVRPGYIYTTADSGQTWTERTKAPASRPWRTAASSASNTHADTHAHACSC